jgi:D-3-phosphoglycerate dehydrogenase
MMDYSYATLNNIAQEGISIVEASGLKKVDPNSDPNVLLLRSADLHSHTFGKSLLAVARAGAGVNNIPIDLLTSMGIPVFNAPGANANAVKELVIASILLAARNLIEASTYISKLDMNDPLFKKNIENGKKQFVGTELPGKTLGVIGLGSIGLEVANSALALGMQVVGYDPSITVNHAWQLSSKVKQSTTLVELLKQSDYITIHVPLIEQTKNLINIDNVATIKNGCVLLNFSRDGIISSDALSTALGNNVYKYVTDFSDPVLFSHPNVITFPHLGASTYEAELNCAVMVSENICRFIRDGAIINSVNFPNTSLLRSRPFRLLVINENIPNMVGQITTVLANHSINISDFLNSSKGAVAVNLLDLDISLGCNVLDEIRQIKGVLSARYLE